MVFGEMGVQLHNKAARGQSFSPEEQMQLDDRYSAQDQAEIAEYDLTSPMTLETLSAQINSVLAQLAATTKRIQELTAENAALQRKVIMYRRRLAQQVNRQPG